MKNSGATDTKTYALLDAYLGQCVKACLDTAPCPPWPDSPKLSDKQISDRIAFHGIALTLVNNPEVMSLWPEAIAGEVREEARRQSFWESSHRPQIAALLEAFHAAGIKAVVTKGTALAYSVYAQPAQRRRGDTDIVILNSQRRATRNVMKACGFFACHDARALQETWQADASPNFSHQVDLHWRINASAAIAERLERIDPFSRSVALPDLSSHARGLAPADNLLLICLNRAAHSLLGYGFGAERKFEGDRLIWAFDIDLITRTLSEEDWDAITQRAAVSGLSAILLSGLEFAQTTCGTSVPDAVIKRLQAASHEDEASAILAPSAADWRLRLDLAASPKLADKARSLRYALFPSREFLRSRYPNAESWPTFALALRRMVSGVGKWLRRRL